MLFRSAAFSKTPGAYLDEMTREEDFRAGIIAAVDAAAAVDGDAQLSRYSDEEIAAEYLRRAQAKLGDPRIGVSSKRG